MSKDQRKNVLQDHRKKGKKFIPPMLQIPNTKPIRATYQAIPEFLWLASLNHFHGWNVGTTLAVSMAEKATTIFGKNIEGFQDKEGTATSGLFAAASAYLDLSSEQKSQLIDSLKLSLEWELIIEGLAPVISWYPECPLAFIVEKAMLLPNNDELNVIKAIVDPLFDKTSKEAVAMYANAVYITFATKKAKAAKGLGFENFPKIEKYPETEESRAMAAIVRATALPLLSMSKISLSWADYFWNNGIKISTCE